MFNEVQGKVSLLSYVTLCNPWYVCTNPPPKNGRYIRFVKSLQQSAKNLWGFIRCELLNLNTHIHQSVYLSNCFSVLRLPKTFFWSKNLQKHQHFLLEEPEYKLWILLSGIFVGFSLVTCKLKQIHNKNFHMHPTRMEKISHVHVHSIWWWWSIEI